MRVWHSPGRGTTPVTCLIRSILLGIVSLSGECYTGNHGEYHARIRQTHWSRWFGPTEECILSICNGITIITIVWTGSIRFTMCFQQKVYS